MLPKGVRIEGELHEDVHLGGLLTHDQLTIVSGGELVQAEETQVSKDLVQRRVVAICAARTPLKEDFREDLSAQASDVTKGSSHLL